MSGGRYGNLRRKGRWYEEKAWHYLSKKGFKLIKTNFQAGREEIDLIALSPQQVLVFVEVKYRRLKGKDFINPYACVSLKKQRHLTSAAQSFLDKNLPYRAYAARYDVVLILKKDGTKETIEHLENAF